MEDSKQLVEAKFNLVSRLGIPKRTLRVINGTDGNRITETSAVLGVRQYEDKSILVLAGAAGCGKSVAAALWLTGHVWPTSRWKQAEGEWQFTEELPAWSRASEFSRVDHYDDDDVQPLLLAPRLVIDDCGEEYLDKFGFCAALFDEVISTRHEQDRPTLITTRLSFNEFIARYGERMYSRLRENGRVVECGYIDQRGELPAAHWVESHD